MTRSEGGARRAPKRRSDPAGPHTGAMRTRLRLALLATFVIGLVLSGLGAVVAKSPEQRDQIDAADRVAQRFEANIDDYVTAAAAKVKSKHDADQDGYPALL